MMETVFEYTDCGGDGDTLRVDDERYPDDRYLYFSVNDSPSVIIKPDQAYKLMGVLIKFMEGD